ncbi:hypothetical protein APA_179 [Pseudanabaena sp. lw0831]|uniref:hypothetical protein n=1 Tax=Pseudanabaena sp. lw0831 TaxID=1357935 RepID=UPI0019163298|nr:hypothetical protein [Pseudanabaena sp. lw0831]GBO52510.1 hypothetical protein APA_179 [Pseudanabaena sp. lw0831]
MTLFTCDDSIKLDDYQKLLLSKHFSQAGSNMMPHQLAASLGLKYSTALLILTLLGLSERTKSSLLIYHNCDPSVPAGAIPYGTGFPKLPWHCSLCEEEVEDYSELSFDVRVTALDPIEFI